MILPPSPISLRVPRHSEVQRAARWAELLVVAGRRLALARARHRVSRRLGSLAQYPIEGKAYGLDCPRSCFTRPLLACRPQVAQACRRLCDRPDQRQRPASKRLSRTRWFRKRDSLFKRDIERIMQAILRKLN